jgi:hypothetical protein
MFQPNPHQSSLQTILFGLRCQRSFVVTDMLGLGPRSYGGRAAAFVATGAEAGSALRKRNGKPLEVGCPNRFPGSRQV